MTGVRWLHEGWTVQLVDMVPGALGDHVQDSSPVLNATVPGCVHTDLLAAGLIEDPYLDGNEAACAWIGHAAWQYQQRFEIAEGVLTERVDLVCLGLDTVATVTLNGVEVGRTANMHRSYRFDVRDLLRVGGNRLAVRFDSAYDYAEAVRDAVGARPNAYDEPFQYIRKMACNFGWDWGPTLVTAGIWRPIGLHHWSGARLDEVRPLATVEGRVGVVDVHVVVERVDDRPLTVRAALGDQRAAVTLPPGEVRVQLRLEIADPALWWPRGHGDQPLYPVRVALHDSDGILRDHWTRPVGFRSIRFDTSADDAGSAFTLIVNDAPMFVRGANWIPDDAFPTRVDSDRYETRMRQACDAGVNLLRVWGGGRYESDEFYDLADRLGLMVGQDFLFACAAYPEEEPLASQVEAEAREQVARLASHPSLVMWVGNNENLWGHADWGWAERLDGRSWGQQFYFQVLPEIVSRLDPTRFYWPGNPYSGDPAIHPNDPDHGTTHIWDVWNTHDYTHYRAYRPRFVAEFGFQAPPTYATLRRAVSDEPLTPDSPGVAHRQKAIDGNGKLLRGLVGHLPAPRTFDDWHWTTQLNQARAIRFGIEHFRSLRPHCMGTIVWQLNDCWPVTSWAAIDGDGRRKPMWYALRAAYRDRLLTFQPGVTGRPELVAVNERGTPWQLRVDVARCRFSGERRASVAVDVDVEPYSAHRIELPADVAVSEESSRELIVAGSPAERATWFFAEDVELDYPRPEYGWRLDGDRLTITARSLLRDLTLFPDRLDPTASVDDALVTLLVGESATFTLRGTGRLNPAALTSHPVLRCANDLCIVR